MIKFYLVLVLFFPVFANACGFPVGFPTELLPPECLAPSPPAPVIDSALTPEVFERQWLAGNNSRLIMLQSARLNPYSSKYLKFTGGLDLNNSIDNFEIETIERGDESAEIGGRHLYWYGENFFYDGGSYNLIYNVINDDFTKQEKRISYYRGVLGYRFKPIEQLYVSFGMLTNTSPRIQAGVFTEKDERQHDIFITMSGFGLHYYLEGDDEGRSQSTSYKYKNSDFQAEVSWLKVNKENGKFDSEYTASVFYEWESSHGYFNNSIKLSRNELVNSFSENWCVDLEFEKFTFYYLEFDQPGLVRESKYGYGIETNIASWIPKHPSIKKISKNTGLGLGVHYNNVNNNVLAVEDELVWSLTIKLEYGRW